MKYILLFKVLYSTSQGLQGNTFIPSSPNDIVVNSMEALSNRSPIAQTSHDVKELEVRREAIGSDRRDESVMGPPLASFVVGSIDTNNQREVPTGEDAPLPLQTYTMSSTFPQTEGLSDANIQHNNDTRLEETSSVQRTADSLNSTNNRAKNKKYQSKRGDEDRDSNCRTNQTKSKKHSKGGRRSSNSEDYERDSRRLRHRSPSSITSSSDDGRSSDNSDSEER